MQTLSAAVCKHAMLSAAASRVLVSGPRTLTLSCTSVTSSSSKPSTDDSAIITKIHRQMRSISSIISRPFSERKNLVSSPSSYTALRNKVTLKFDEVYDSPYSDFFANIDAGSTSLGTTEEMEQSLSNLMEQKLDCGINESDLRFRTTSYGRFALPPYVSPGEHRVTVVLNLNAIPWDEQRGEAEKEILLQIVGPRYNAEKNELKLSSEKFGSRIENKRYLVGMIEKIVSSSKKLAKDFEAEDEKTKAIR